MSCAHYLGKRCKKPVDYSSAVGTVVGEVRRTGVVPIVLVEFDKPYGRIEWLEESQVELLEKN
jgi:hypothetical protein